MDSEEASVLMKHQPTGSYLVRFGSTQPDVDLPPKNCFSMVMKINDSVKKVQIIKDPQTGRYTIAGSEYKFDAIESVVASLCKDLRLHTPCSPHPFAPIFAHAGDAIYKSNKGG